MINSWMYITYINFLQSYYSWNPEETPKNVPLLDKTEKAWFSGLSTETWFAIPYLLPLNILYLLIQDSI